MWCIDGSHGIPAGLKDLFATDNRLENNDIACTRQKSTSKHFIWMNIDNATCWYVMKHHEMKFFMEWLKIENAQRLTKGETIVEPFYPDDFLKEGKDGH